MIYLFLAYDFPIFITFNIQIRLEKPIKLTDFSAIPDFFERLICTQAFEATYQGQKKFYYPLSNGGHSLKKYKISKFTPQKIRPII
jgi:hypothetical protein